MTPRPRHSEDGSALIIALVFLTTFGVIVAALLSFSEVSIRASKSFDEKARSADATDGAVNAAINRFRRGGACDDYAAPNTGPDGQPLFGPGIIVHCVDDNRPASARATRPVNALLSLGAGGISTATGAEQRIAGNVFSNSTVTAGGPLTVQGQISATGDCTGPIRTSPAPVPPATGAVHCANTGGGADASQGRDPDYAKAAAAVPIHRNVPPCPAASWLVELKPGSYDDAAALSNLTNGGCPGRVVWLEPGSYYLDFTFRGGPGTWAITDSTIDVVAGTPKGWVPAPTATRPTLTVPGSCQTEADAPSAVGVQIIAGGGTHLQVTRGHVELCATPSSTDQSIALYGIAGQPSHSLQPNDWSGVSGFTNPANATTIGETPPLTADALLPAGPATASMTVTGFRPGVPEGSFIDSAVVRVAHQEDPPLDPPTLAVTFPGSTACAPPLAKSTTTSPYAEDRFELKGCGVTEPAALAGLAVTYRASSPNGAPSATDRLEGIAVDVVYRDPRTGKPTSTTSSGFTDPDNAREIGEQPQPPTAKAGPTATATTASISMAGLGDPPIPPGSTIDSARLRVAHREDVVAPDAAPVVKVATGFPGSTCAGTAGSPARDVPISLGRLVDFRVDLKAACGLGDAAQLPPLTVSYAATLTGGTATADLDGIWLELVYRPPPPTHVPATAAPGPTPTAYANPDRATAIDGATADAALDGTSPTASLTFGGFDQPTIPAGSFLDTAVLRVVHRDAGSMSTPSLGVAFAGSTCTPLLARRTSLGEDRVDLKACGLDDPAKLAGLTATFTATLTGGAPATATSHVDGVVLDLAYRPAATHRPSTVNGPAFLTPENARTIGEAPSPLTADVTLATGAAPAPATLSDFGGITPGSVIDAAVLRVAHQEDPLAGVPTLGVTFPGNACATRDLTRRPALGQDRVDLLGCGLDDPSKLAALAATYTAKPPTSATDVESPTAVTEVTGFTNPDNAKLVGEQPVAAADAHLGGADPTTASIKLGGYAQTPPPPGSTLTDAVLRIVHQEEPGVAQTTTVSFPGGTCTPTTTTNATMSATLIPLKECGFTDLSKLSGLTVTYAVNLAAGAGPASANLDGAVLDLTYQPPPATDRLDGIELDVVFRAPTFEPLSGCTTVPFPGTPCPLVSVVPAPDAPAARFAAQGTIYAPSATIDISMSELKDQVLSRGLVARSIRLGLKADPGYKRPLIAVPPEPVKFTAYPDVRAAATSTTSSPGFAATSGKALAIDGDPAVVDLTTDAPASLTVSGYPAPTLPPDSARVLRIAHGVDPGVESATVTLGGVPAGPCTSPFPLSLYAAPASPAAPFKEDQIDLAPCGITDAQLATLTVTYTATLSTTAPPAPVNARLDGITLDLLSRPLLKARVAFDNSRDVVEVKEWSVLR